ncbi:MAG: GDP-mannose 4,6-dehydratase, partial [Lachnospiraceae bacterium]|nr:GDP-mannose 4,6-dehydratase [Lachnospiraceae bacterium]
AGETYNIGSGRAVAIEDILNMILEYARADIRVEIDRAKFRPVDVPVIEADVRKVQELTGWKPEIALEQTVRNTLDYWRGLV